MPVSDRHLSSIDIPDDHVTFINENRFSVRSSTNSNTFYTITRISNTCLLQSCFKRCTTRPCNNLCTHLFKCSCHDEDLLCKHIHKVHSMCVTAPQENNDEDFTELRNTACTTTTTCKSKEKSCEKLISEITKDIETLQKHLQSPNANSLPLQSISVNLKKIIQMNEATLKSSNSTPAPLVPILKVQSRQKFEKQPTFKKKATVKRCKVLRAPTEEEKSNLLTSDNCDTHTRSTPSVPSVAPYPLVPMPPTNVATINLEQQHDTTSFIDENGAVSIPSNFLIPPALYNRRLAIRLENGKVLHIKASRQNNEDDIGN